MNKNQYLPLLFDAHHFGCVLIIDFADYLYFKKPGYGEIMQERVTVHFEGDSLAGVTGTMLPSPDGPDPEASRQVTVVVPPEERIPPGIFNRLWHYLTFRKPGGEDNI